MKYKAATGLLVILTFILNLSIIPRVAANVPPPFGSYGNNNCFCPGFMGPPADANFYWLPYCYEVPPQSGNWFCEYPQLLFIGLSVPETPVVGYQTVVSGMFQIQAGTLECAQNPGCLRPWWAWIETTSWSANETTPSAGSLVNYPHQPFAVVRSAQFVPDTAGIHTITFQVNANSEKPHWNPAAMNFNAEFYVEQKKRLATWRFNDSFVGEEGQQPVATPQSVTFTPSWNQQAANMSAIAPTLTYRAVEMDGQRNINRYVGSIRLWFRPDWNSGSFTGTGNLIEITGDGLTLKIVRESNETRLKLENGYGATHLTSPNVNWAANYWYNVVVTYSSAETKLYVDGVLKVTGNGLSPGGYSASQFRVGSGAAGANPAMGAFDELSTYNYPLTQTEVTGLFNTDISLDSDGDLLTNLYEVTHAILHEGQVRYTDPYNPDTDNDGCMDGADAWPLDPNSCTISLNDPTPPIIQLIHPVNAVNTAQQPQ